MSWPETFPLALDILADILTESAFDSLELEREKGVILQEIGAVEDTPDDLRPRIAECRRVSGSADWTANSRNPGADRGSAGMRSAAISQLTIARTRR